MNPAVVQDLYVCTAGGARYFGRSWAVRHSLSCCRRSSSGSLLCIESTCPHLLGGVVLGEQDGVRVDLLSHDVEGQGVALLRREQLHRV